MRVCVSAYSECVYLLLVSHGALSSHHNLAAGLRLQLFGCQSTWAQDPPYEVKLHKRAKHTHNKTSPKEDGHILDHRLKLSVHNVCVFPCAASECAFEVCASVMCLCY